MQMRTDLCQNVVGLTYLKSLFSPILFPIRVDDPSVPQPDLCPQSPSILSLQILETCLRLLHRGVSILACQSALASLILLMPHLIYAVELFLRHGACEVT